MPPLTRSHSTEIEYRNHSTGRMVETVVEYPTVKRKAAESWNKNEREKKRIELSYPTSIDIPESEDEEDDDNDGKEVTYLWQQASASDSGGTYTERWLKDLGEAKEYLRQVRESQGFDVDLEVVPPVKHRINCFKSVVPISSYKGVPIKEFCDLALVLYNNNKRNKIKYHFHKLAYGNRIMGYGYHYFLTFYAHPIPNPDHDRGEQSQQSPVVFEAKVYHCSLGNPIIRVELCWIKGIYA